MSRHGEAGTCRSGMSELRAVSRLSGLLSVSVKVQYQSVTHSRKGLECKTFQLLPAVVSSRITVVC